MRQSKTDMQIVEIVAGAMHDSALGLDRSVCLRDIVEALQADGFADAANHLVDAVDDAASNRASGDDRRARRWGGNWPRRRLLKLPPWRSACVEPPVRDPKEPRDMGNVWG